MFERKRFREEQVVWLGRGYRDVCVCVSVCVYTHRRGAAVG